MLHFLPEKEIFNTDHGRRYILGLWILLSFYGKRNVDFALKAVKLLVNDLELTEAWFLHFGKMGIFEFAVSPEKILFYPEEKPTKDCLPSHRKSEHCTNKTGGKSILYVSTDFQGI